MGLSRAFMGSLKPHLKYENAKKPNNQTQPLKRLQPELQLSQDTPEGTMHSQDLFRQYISMISALKPSSHSQLHLNTTDSFEDLIYTYRIFREHQGYFRIETSEGIPARLFRTLKDLIYSYEKPNQGLITNLRYPVMKPKASQRNQRFKSEKDDIYDGINDSDYVTVLP
ncbi:hypothetical protein Q9233_013168 [Columba guinea]|nr:hypothetical protein Q9233_013168 [Columba guinea]